MICINKEYDNKVDYADGSFRQSICHDHRLFNANLNWAICNKLNYYVFENPVFLEAERNLKND